MGLETPPLQSLKMKMSNVSSPKKKNRALKNQSSRGLNIHEALKFKHKSTRKSQFQNSTVKISSSSVIPEDIKMMDDDILINTPIGNQYDVESFELHTIP